MINTNLIRDYFSKFISTLTKDFKSEYLNWLENGVLKVALQLEISFLKIAIKKEQDSNPGSPDYETNDIGVNPIADQLIKL